MKTPEAFSLAALHPHMMGATRELTEALRTFVFEVGGEHFVFHPFEGFRHPLRQYELFARGGVTKARPWESAHQYGLAVDFAARRVEKLDGGQIILSPGGWAWPDDAPWGKLKTVSRRVGLDVPIKWDKGHVEHPLWKTVREATR